MTDIESTEQSENTATKRAKAPRTPLAMLVQVEEQYGTYRVVARVVLPQGAGSDHPGELHTPSWGSYLTPRDARRFEGLEVAAYAGNTGHIGAPGEDAAWAKLWGFGIRYRPYQVESAEHAKAIAGVMATIDRGLERAERTDGFIREGAGEFARYVLRVARALKITDVYVRNSPKRSAMTGDRYRLADAVTLDYWAQDVTEHITNHTMGELVRN